MMKKFQQWWFCVCLLISGMMTFAQDVEDALTIAILAPMGAQETLESWQGFQTLLVSHLDRSVVVLPVTFEEFQTVAKDASVDLLIANQTAFLSIFPEVKWRWLASLDQNSALFNPESCHWQCNCGAKKQPDSHIRRFKRPASDGGVKRCIGRIFTGL